MLAVGGASGHGGAALRSDHRAVSTSRVVLGRLEKHAMSRILAAAGAFVVLTALAALVAVAGVALLATNGSSHCCSVAHATERCAAPTVGQPTALKGTGSSSSSQAACSAPLFRFLLCLRPRVCAHAPPVTAERPCCSRPSSPSIACHGTERTGTPCREREKRCSWPNGDGGASTACVATAPRDDCCPANTSRCERAPPSGFDCCNADS